ncbi:HSPB1-associated protein 1 isoform X2 [Periplaneta americana]|uniref:HSPB1-associated protein 1 isoform X2 n=1 Tax=Periplaneta americana TaxID=6978 RepID=UPI0037E89B94
MSNIELPPEKLTRQMILKGFEVPVVFKGFINDWELLSWDLDNWAQKLGDAVLPFRSGCRKFTKEPQWEGSCQKINLTMKEFVEWVHMRENAASDESDRWMYFDYKYMNEWFAQQPSILNAVTWKNFGFPERGGADSTIWIGSDGAHTPCHMDVYGCNLVAQLYGRKQWILFPPDKITNLLPTRIPYEESSIYSNLNFYSPDPDLANDLQEAYVVTLNPGEVLFVPHHWWHFVQNLGTAVSINSWIPLENLVEDPVSKLVQQIEVCREICQQKSASIGDFMLDATSSKKPKLVKDSETQFYGETSEEDFLSKFKNFISIVPKYSAAHCRSLLHEKWKQFTLQKKETALAADDNKLLDVVNAFCHPDVIAKVKDRILSKK